MLQKNGFMQQAISVANNLSCSQKVRLAWVHRCYLCSSCVLDLA